VDRSQKLSNYVLTCLASNNILHSSHRKFRKQTKKISEQNAEEIFFHEREIT
jgi:hypothetical protein